MDTFLSESNYNKLFQIVESNIKQSPDFVNNLNIEFILRNKINDISSVYGITYQKLNPKQQLHELNSRTIEETIPKLIENLNNLKKSKEANLIESYIKKEFIPQAEVKMDTRLMYPEVNTPEFMQRMFQDTSNINFNDRNSLQVQSAEISEPKDMYKPNEEAKQLLEKKQEDELHSNQKLLDITSNIYNETMKNRDRYIEEFFTVNSLDRNKTAFNFQTDSKFVVNFGLKSTDSQAAFANLIKGYKDVIGLELVSVQIPLAFWGNTTADGTLGISQYDPILVSGGGTFNAVPDPDTFNQITHVPYVYLSIEEFNDKTYNTSTKTVFTKLTKYSKNGLSGTLDPSDGKKIFRRSELKNINRLTIELLQPDGTPFIPVYGGWDIGSSGVINAVSDSSVLYAGISLDFKVTILESAFEFIN
jgi:hypothetical protein